MNQIEKVVEEFYAKHRWREHSPKMGELLVEELEKALDRVQKNLEIPDAKIKQLRRAKLIEGRKPNLHVSAKVAAATSSKSTYIKNRAFDDQHYTDMIIEFIKKYGAASRKDIDDLLLTKLSDALSETQKITKVGNLLSDLRIKEKIVHRFSSK